MPPLDVSLTDLVGRLDAEFADADDLARITEAQLRARTLSDLGEQLVGHYVGKAKQAGASWSQIGDAIGVSKQAAQQRHTPSAFDGFTDLTRHTIVLAQEAARAHKHDSIGTEHLLIGLISERRGLAYEILVAKAGSEQRVRETIEEAMPPAGKKSPRGHIAFRPESKLAIEQASAASVEFGPEWVGTEHLLLGLVRVEQGPAAQILRGLGLTPDGIQQAIEKEIRQRAVARPS